MIVAIYDAAVEAYAENAMKTNTVINIDRKKVRYSLLLLLVILVKYLFNR